jgi:hypothetical protein
MAVITPEAHRGGMSPEVISEVINPLIWQQRLEVSAMHTGDDYVHHLEQGLPIVTEGYNEAVAAVRVCETFPDKRIVAKHSAHEVTFGRLLAHRANGKERKDRPVLSVAYKPFKSAAKAVQELQGYKVLQALGVETFDPVAVIPSEEQGSFVVVTRKRDDLMSLDRDEWVVGRQPHDLREVEIHQRNSDTVKNIAEMFAYLHSNGVFHPDGQVKNFAVTARGTVGVIDTENLHVQATDSIDMPQLAWNDLQKFVKSLIISNLEEDSEGILGVGMLANMGLPQLRASVQELIIDPYMKALEGRIEKGADEDQLTELAYYIHDRFQRDAHWPMNLVGLIDAETNSQPLQ